MRIIAGEFKGRQILSPVGMTTRPITDRVKSALFNALFPRLEGSAVADLFCGTGSMGLEALSRGARHCCFADRDASAIQLLRRNIAALGLAGRSTVWEGDIIQRLPGWLAKLPHKLDVIFLDPPYVLAEGWKDAPESHAALFNPLAEALAEGGLVMFRTPRALEVPATLGKLVLARRKEYGTMALNYLKAPSSEPADPQAGQDEAAQE